jgi:hypothetical protein
MIIIPLGLEDDTGQRPIVAPTIAFLTLYHSILPMYLPGTRAVLAPLLSEPPTSLDFWAAAAVGLFAGATPMGALMQVIFWLVIGYGVEKIVGAFWLIAGYLAGAAALVAAHRAGLVAWERDLWLGLGGTLFCMGIAYARAWDRNVRFFYLVGSLLGVKMGYSTTATFFIVAAAHLYFAAQQIVDYTGGKLKRPPGDWSAAWYALICPILVLILFVIVNTGLLLIAPLRGSGSTAASDTGPTPKAR